ncbi:MAG: glycosyltransferase family 4 protein [Coriobacteriia bacterium]|nr:glycosyltransferase family 4 protein [Coriobacteriia bacterium]
MTAPSRAASASTPQPVASQRTELRILLLAQFYPPIIGGIEVHVQTLARGLVVRGHEVAVATLATAAEKPGERLDEGVHVHSLQGAVQRIGFLHATERRHAIPLADPELVGGLRRLARDFEPDVVHAHNWLGRSYVPLKREIGAPYVVSLHDSGRICTQGRMMFRGQELCTGPTFGRCLSCCAVQFGAAKGTVTYLGNRLARGAEARETDLFLPVSSAVADSNHLAADGLPFEVVPNFAEDATPQLPCADPRLAELPAEPFILQVGDVVADKGVDVLFKAYRSMPSPPPLVLIGRIAESVRTALPPGAISVGPWPHDLVLEAWRRSMFGTMPSLCLDACPTVTFEAMAAAKPVVGSALGGLLDQIVDGDTGMLVPAGDALALAQAMSRLAADAPLRKQMGAAARSRFEAEFQAGVVIDRIEAIYQRLAGAAR